MNRLQKLEQIYNWLMQLKVDGKNVVLLGSCIVTMEEVIIQMQQELHSPSTVQVKEENENVGQ